MQGHHQKKFDHNLSHMVIIFKHEKLLKHIMYGF